MATFTNEVNVNDMIDGMNRFEKQEMVDELYDEGYMPEQLQKDLDVAEGKIPGSNLEQELYNILNKVWDNKMFLNNDDLEVLKHLSKKGL